MSKTTKNSLFLTIAALIWGLAFVAQTSGGDIVGPYSFNCVRNLIGAAVLVPVMLIFDKVGISKKPTTKESKRIVWIGGAVTGVALCVASNLQQVGISLGASTGKAGFLTACYIILVPILGIFIKKKCPVNVWIAVVIALVGLYLLCMNDRFSFEFADVLLLLCALAFSVQILCVDHYAPLIDGIRLSIVQFLTCGILTAIPMIFLEVGHSSISVSAWVASFSTLDAWLPLLYAAVLSSGVAYTLQVFGQNGLNPTIASLIMSLESVFALLGGWLILHQHLSTRELIGCAVLFIAIIFAQIPTKK